MHKLEELKQRLCDELSEYADRSKLDAQTLEVVDKLAHTVKNLDKIIENTGYSGTRRRYAYDGQNGYSMNRNGYYSGDDSYNGYSMDSMQDIKKELRDIMNSADGHTKQSLQRIISQI
jgi:hypothetical protein